MRIDDTFWTAVRVSAVMVPLACLFWAYVFSVYLEKRQKKLHGENILLVIAHPDDESMFFVPAL